MRDKPFVVSCRLTRYEYELLEAICRKNGLTANDAIRMALTPMLLAASGEADGDARNIGQ